MVLGSIDREFLEGDSLAPERQLWWDCGVDWIQRLTVEGAGHLVKHPSYDVTKVVRS